MSAEQPETMPREKATVDTACPTCGDDLAVQEEREDGSKVLDSHDHGEEAYLDGIHDGAGNNLVAQAALEAQARQAEADSEQAAADSPPRELGTQPASPSASYTAGESDEDEEGQA